MTDYYYQQPARPPGRPGQARPLLAGGAAALAGACAWAAIAYATGYQFELLAMLTGLATGLAATRRVPAPPSSLRAASAALAVAGCALGTLIAMAAILDGKHGIGLGVIISHLGTVLQAYPDAVGWEGVLFWAVAAAAAAFPPGHRPARRAIPGREAIRVRPEQVTFPRHGQAPDLDRYLGADGPGSTQPYGPGSTQPCPRFDGSAPAAGFGSYTEPDSGRLG